MTSFFEGLLEHATECICADSWIAKDSSQLTIHFGDHINIIERTTDDWWYGECNEEYGYAPTNYIKLRLDNFIDIFNVQTRIQMEGNPDEHTEEIEQCSIDNIEKNLFQDKDYFEGYNSIKIHHEMLTDVARTRAYENAVKSLAPFIKDKIVLDVGCGTGILSIFCAKAGAKHVYGVEASQFAFKTRKIVEANNLNGLISIIHGKIEDIFLPVEKVDVIISEWMGTMLITESMICSVLYARDNYLRGYIKQKDNTKAIRKRLETDDNDTESMSDDDDTDDAEIIVMDNDDNDDDEEEEKKQEVSDDTKDDEKESKQILQPPPLPKHLMDGVIKNRGLIMPSHCNLYFGPIDLSDHIDEKIDYFDDVYGCNMKVLREDAIELYLAHATYEIEIDGKNLLCDKGICLKQYDMYNCTEMDDLETLDHKFEFVIDKDEGLFCGFAGWFDVIFNPSKIDKMKNDNNNNNNDDVVVLDTSPKCKRTHWSQTLFPMSQQIKVKKGDVITGKLCFFRNNVSIRHYRMFIQCKVHDKIYRKMFFLWD